MSSLPGQNPPSSTVTAEQIAKSLQDASDPLEFINRNLQQIQVQQPPVAINVPRPHPAPQAAEPTPPIPPVEEPPPLIQEPPKEPIQNDLLSQVTKKGPEDSIKDLRKKANEYKSQVEE